MKNQKKKLISVAHKGKTVFGRHKKNKLEPLDCHNNHTELDDAFLLQDDPSNPFEYDALLEEDPVEYDCDCDDIDYDDGRDFD